jgi:hypothetical protein
VEHGKGLPKSDLDTIAIHRRHISRRKLGAFFAEVKPGTDRSIDVSLLPMSEHKRLCCHTHRLPVRTVSRRYNEAWISLPEHLHYILESWGTDLPASVKLMLLISYLAYLYNEFLVQSLLSKDSGETGASHLDVSATILSTVLILGRQWEQSVAIQRDLTWIVSVSFKPVDIYLH